ncbi:TonB-dependent receptor [Chitinophaga pendula]|uniref:TonB-dependent receptor n=1 Tax=Chitinophaga TaxID=79328 RepID=UPI0018E01AE5|nr:MULTISPECIES: TonB-dependent receptor [Chitinophaga]UCJ06308.1 TonB-dependent receptor [Chitinophaga pendula]
MKRLLTACCYYSLLIACLIPQSLTAQNTPNDTSRHLREINVNAKYLLDNTSSPTPAQTLDIEQLKKLTATSVADAIKSFSGVQIKDYGGIGGLKTVNVRSLGSNHVGVFYDGIQVGNPQNGSIDLGKFSLDNLEMITLFNGQSNDIFLPARNFSAASTLYLKPIKPSFAKGENIHGKATFKTGSFGLLNPGLLWQQKINDRISASISTEWINANGRYKFKRDEADKTPLTRTNADINAFRVEAAVNGNMKDSSDWSLRLYHYQSERGLPGYILVDNFDHRQRQEDRNIFIQAHYKKTFHPKYSLLVNAKFANDYMRYTDPDVLNTAKFQDNRYTQQELYLSLANKYSIKSWWDLSLSGDFIYNYVKGSQVGFAFPTRYTGYGALATAIKLPQLELQANLLGTAVSESVKFGTAAPNKQILTPAISIAYQPLKHEEFYIRAFYKDIFRMPTLNDLYYLLIGNAKLKPEYTKQYNLGLTWRKMTTSALKNFSIQVDAYYNNVTDKIVAIPTANMFRWTMINLGKVDIKGVDITQKNDWQLPATITLHTDINYTWQHARELSFGINNPIPVPYMPTHSGAVNLGLEWRTWELTYRFNYVGDRFADFADPPKNYMPAWYTSDIVAAYNLRTRKFKDIRFTAELNNILNKYYDVAYNYPMPGRNFRFMASFSF